MTASPDLIRDMQALTAEQQDVARRAKRLTKGQIENLARAVGWRGDGPRTRFATFLDIVTHAALDEEHYATLTAELIRMETPAMNNVTPLPSRAPGAGTAPDAAMVAQLQQALAALLGTPKLDMEEIAATIEQKVADAIAALQPTKVYVTPAGEWAPPEGERVHAAFERVAKLAAIRQNILLVGPAGCGKTALAEQVAKSLSLPFASISCSAGMSESQVLGYLLPTGEGGRFEYVASDFVRLYETGGVFLFDELDAADENMLVTLNQALANGGFFLPQRRDNPFVKRHPDFVCIAAANTYGHGADRIYAGRNKLDGATLDRFRAGIVGMDYDTELERHLCDGTALAFVHEVRAAINAHRLQRVASTRIALDFTRQLAAKVSTMDDCKASYFADWTRDERAKVAHLLPA